MSEIEITDRYRALGIPYPNQETCCEGQCEGTGAVPFCNPDFRLNDDARRLVPIRQDDDAKFYPLWEAAHSKPHDEPCDGWHFVVCPDCGGSGKRP